MADSGWMLPMWVMGGNAPEHAWKKGRDRLLWICGFAVIGTRMAWDHAME